MTDYYTRLKEKMGVNQGEASESETEQFVAKTVSRIRKKDQRPLKKVHQKVEPKIRLKPKEYQKIETMPYQNLKDEDESEDKDDVMTIKSRLFYRPSTHLEHYRRIIHSSCDNTTDIPNLTQPSPMAEPRVSTSMSRRRTFKPKIAQNMKNFTNTQTDFRSTNYRFSTINRRSIISSQANRSICIPEHQSTMNSTKMDWNALHSK